MKLNLCWRGRYFCSKRNLRAGEGRYFADSAGNGFAKLDLRAGEGRLLELELSNWTCQRLESWLPYIDWREPWMLLEIAEITESKLLLLR